MSVVGSAVMSGKWLTACGVFQMRDGNGMKEVPLNGTSFSSYNINTTLVKSIRRKLSFLQVYFFRWGKEREYIILLIWNFLLVSCIIGVWIQYGKGLSRNMTYGWFGWNFKWDEFWWVAFLGGGSRRDSGNYVQIASLSSLLSFKKKEILIKNVNLIYYSWSCF